jgi:Na+/melibiose symporter-like transporter
MAADKNLPRKAVLLNNRPLIIIVISLFLSLTATVIRQSAIIYFTYSFIQKLSMGALAGALGASF